MEVLIVSKPVNEIENIDSIELSYYITEIVVLTQKI